MKHHGAEKLSSHVLKLLSLSPGRRVVTAAFIRRKSRCSTSKENGEEMTLIFPNHGVLSISTVAETESETIVSGEFGVDNDLCFERSKVEYSYKARRSPSTLWRR